MVALSVCGVQGPAEAWTKITVDSAAEESACAQGWGAQFGLKECVGDPLRLVDCQGGQSNTMGPGRSGRLQKTAGRLRNF